MEVGGVALDILDVVDLVVGSRLSSGSKLLRYSGSGCGFDLNQMVLVLVSVPLKCSVLDHQHKGFYHQL